MSAIRQTAEAGLGPMADEPKRVEQRKIGRYHLKFELAAGGMATVFLARVEGPSGFDKLVALKRIHPHLASDRAYVDMFLDEARIASRITHANVCSVFDFGEADGSYFIAMEYLVGESLSRVVRHLAKEKAKAKDKAYPSYCARIIADACEGLHAAHELKDARGEPLHVVHRDISPQNIFISYDGVVRIVDFGIASARDKLYQTSTGEVKGKFAYMSPEQLKEATKVDRRTDVWALGVVLWEMLTMRRLFRKGTQPETMYAVLEAEVPAPSSVRNGVPPELDAIVLKALAREREDRYETAREMGRALVDYLSRSDHPVGLADVSEWMSELFPGGEARTRQIMDIARLPTGGVPALGRDSIEVEPSDSFSSIRTVTATPEPLAAKQKRQTRMRLLAGAVLVAGALGGAALALWWTDEPTTPIGVQSPASDPPAATEPGTSVHEPSPAEAPAVPEGLDPPGAPGTDAPAVDETEPPTEPAGASATAPPTATPELPAESPTPTRRRRRRAATPASPPPAATQDRTPETPTPAAAQTGMVSVLVSGGWANVYDERNRFLGATPLRVELSAGRHRLQLRPFGQPPPTYLDVNVPAGGRARVRHTIDAE